MAESKKWSINTFTGGVNKDDSVESIVDKGYPLEDYFDSYNMRSGGKNGALAKQRVNIKGNIKVDNDLPAGTNKCVGAYEDVYTESIIFHNWNSNGDHGIYQYFPYQLAGTNGRIVPLIKDSELGYNPNWIITGSNLEEKKLYYWVNGFEATNGVQGNPPRKINIVKANDWLKMYEYQYIVNNNMFNELGATALNQVEAEVFDADGVLSSSQVWDFVYTGDRKNGLVQLADQLNQNLGSDVEASTCDCFVDIKMKKVQYTLTLRMFRRFPLTPSGVLQPTVLVPMNFYPKPIQRAYLDRIKSPLLCAPTTTYGSDETRNENLISGRVFQFATKVVYDDKEKSVLSPYSHLAFDPVPCGTNPSQSPYNYIDVDFTDNRLNSTGSMAIIRRVEVFMREGEEGAMSVWSKIADIDRCEYDVNINSYRFYNDGNYPVADSLTGSKLQDEVPEISMAQDHVDNRSFLGGNVEGKNNLECVDASVAVSYKSKTDCEDDLGTITGDIKITNFSVVGNFQINQPIHDDGSGPGYGAMPSSGYSSGEYNTFKQNMPMRGWTVYSAGTNHVTQSVQQVPAGHGITVAAGDGNVYASTSSGQRNAIRSAINAQAVKSIFTLKVKPGRHIIRIASNRVEALDDGTAYDYSAGTRYEATSGYVYNLGGTGDTEIVVDVVAGQTVTIPDTFIEDLTTISTNSHGFVIDGYIHDSRNDSDQEAVNAAPRMERQQFDLVLGNPPLPGGVVHRMSSNNLTDHNGFFFYGILGVVDSDINSREASFNVDSLDFGAGQLRVVSDGDAFYIGDLAVLEAGTATNDSDVDANNEHTEIQIYNNNTDVSDYCRTKIEGVTKDSNGVIIPNVTLIFEKCGRVELSDTNGNFSLTTYGDALINKRIGDLIWRASSACCATFPNGDFQSLNITPFTEGGIYDFTNPFTVTDILIDITALYASLEWKHRNKVNTGAVYYDHAGRITKVQKIGEVYIPHYTEVGGNAGQPLLTYNINHQPPLDAHKYQIVRWLNPVYARYLQFIINEVEYVKYYDTTAGTPAPVTTNYAAGDATEIYLSLESILYFQEENTDSEIGFIPEPGDRVTLIKDENGDFFPEWFDFDLRGDRGQTDILKVAIGNDERLPELKSGSLIELYTPRLSTEDDETFFYEMGECYDILDPETANRRHGAGTDGVAQVLGLPGTPATGIIQSGDTYVRNRNMLTRDATGVKTYYDRTIEDQALYDNDIKSKQQDIGKPNFIDKDYGQYFHRSRVRYSQKYINDGNVVINGFSSFDLITIEGETPFNDIEREYGTIMSLVRVGEKAELLAVMTHKIQPIYIGKSPIYSLNDTEQVTISNKTMNLSRPITNRAGTTNPESIVSFKNYVYGYDMLNEVFWRYDNNGVDYISDIKMRSEVRKLSAFLKLANRNYIKVHGAYDNNNDEVVWALEEIATIQAVELPGLSGGVEISQEDVSDIDTSTLRQAGDSVAIPALTFSFNTRRKRFEGNYEYFPDTLANGTTLGFASFKSGELWLHDKNEIRNNFFGEQKNSRITFVVNNPTPSDIKLFFSTRIVPASEGWSFTLIEMPSNSMYPNGMKSRLSNNQFKGFEGDLWADFLGDYTDPAFAVEVDALFKGRDLRGHVLIITAQNTSTKEVTLQQINVSHSSSMQTV